MSRSNSLLTAAAILLAACSCHVYQTPAEYVAEVPDRLYVEIAAEHAYKVFVECPGDGNDVNGSAVNLGDEYAVTAKHVADAWTPGCTLEVLDNRGVKRAALILEKYAADDLALLLVPGHALPMVPFRKPELGLPVMAVGYPGGVFAVTVGNIGGYPDEDHEVRFTAPIYYGSSGGGVWDMHGNLVGISVNMVTNRALWFNLVPAERIHSYAGP